MIPLDYVLAVAIITTPGNPCETQGVYDHFRSLKPTIQSVAIHWEILDRREIKYVMHRQEDFAGDLKMLRSRHNALWDAPSIHDALRFPERSLISELLSFNRAYRQHLENRLQLELVYQFELREVIKEVDHLYMIWDTVRDARCEYYYIHVRRQALHKLRKLVGQEAYYSGALPPHVPVWRFARID